jgi:hypothetical protein
LNLERATFHALFHRLLYRSSIMVGGPKVLAPMKISAPKRPIAINPLCFIDRS